MIHTYEVCELIVILTHLHVSDDLKMKIATLAHFLVYKVLTATYQHQSLALEVRNFGYKRR